LLYRFLHFLARIIMVVFFRWEVKGLNNVPKSGPLIIVSNHVSYADPVVVGAALNRPVHFMAKEELFHKPFLGWLIRKINAFPVKRGVADRGAIRQGIDLLNQGKVLGIFPEGGRREKVEDAKQGAAFLAYKTGAPILPIALTGTDKVLPKGAVLPRLARIRVNIGRPLALPNQEGLDRKQLISQFSERIMEEIIKLALEGKQS
jgi:1-acyl-sn-glycerol-3-phosphate acyltransferase